MWLHYLRWFRNDTKWELVSVADSYRSLMTWSEKKGGGVGEKGSLFQSVGIALSWPMFSNLLLMVLFYYWVCSDQLRSSSQTETILVLSAIKVLDAFLPKVSVITVDKGVFSTVGGKFPRSTNAGSWPCKLHVVGHTGLEPLTEDAVYT